MGGSVGETLRLMCVHAHPDDESSKGAATTAKYVAEGVQVVVATCTGGERGSVLNPAMDRPDVWQNITQLRSDEMDRAREVLGIEQVWLGFVDSGLPEGDPLPPLPDGSFGLVDPNEAARELVAVIRALRPQVMTTYNEEGGYPHPDHIMCHRISLAAFEQAADPELYPELGEPWQVSKVYYDVRSLQRFVALDEAMEQAGLEPVYADWRRYAEESERAERTITTRIECAEYFPVRDQALLAHATQVDPEGMWFAVPREIEQRVWPTEDYELARSTIKTSVPETDLFAGLR